MTTNTKTIVTCAITGASLTPSMSKALPVTGQEIADQSIAAIKAGAAIVHLHARETDGRPTNAIATWREFVPRIREETDAVINMSASLGSTAEERLEAVIDLRPEIATVIVGSMNYGLFRKAENQGISSFDTAWEREAFGPKSYDIITSNSFAKIDRMMDMLIDHDIGMEFECYDVGHLYILEHHLRRKTVKRPLIIQFLTGILGGIPSDIDHLLHMKRTTERLFGNDAVLFIHGTGTGNIRAAVQGALMGTHVRVGQEDNLFEFPGVPFPSNAAQVEKMGRILREFRIEMATPAEARQTLGL
ncbi:3-keto-5-aminohexanoate cleavage protein [Azospirillum sp. RWY-5-1]|uniref:3-keto-5-aminohexanoate cleavage protein n=1 Tax=Azospirillum oleiclasticum TaxID=2735135 RepID=A0ABX2TM51_9PROT|nr:3-keto-5-aminohexanoate cleavage protein [Azospirillum oleiclasticum]NYZ14526.1 3-keto-5-aminohexanoate cleavage protein [Azospirillum oleiclasticum]NYZ24304.1 3-keto-5-aminohexanoate cleavage protein [Azospirillum oleiclasticum]